MMRITAPELAAFGIIDGVVPEPPEGAHVDASETIATLGAAVAATLRTLREQARRDSIDALLARRFEKYRGIGQWREAERVAVGLGAAASLEP
jgi:acetyl-CoA carboxylase alpha subunit